MSKHGILFVASAIGFMAMLLVGILAFTEYGTVFRHAIILCLACIGIQ